MRRRRTMEWAARAGYLGGIPRKMVFTAVRAFAKAVASFLNSTSVQNADTLIRLVRARPPGLPFSNNMSTFTGKETSPAEAAEYSLITTDVMLEKYIFDRWPPFPLCNKKVDIIIGEPIEFDLPKLKPVTISQLCSKSFPSVRWLGTSLDGLDEAVRRCQCNGKLEECW